ncbi:UDP-N-acetylmuramate--L-alanine ligase [Aquimarina sp. ERC-38]|uniref:UDP-N-acetylmuramate--L-alanine ligase n=1 Tax=Aquimarina sp. ERC-38 TaxID=2949996 RepID=UPI0022480DD5|nr:UDP-N-acetylmuramate--L-alanine ligase [Aquimarina sp. ERC-38]UZO82517.1 UDP-N-acetylmuramate--L-alanine ligase [Aquimarina sp. ERC-38]
MQGVFTNISNFYFIGIGGIGMSALARYLYALDKKVMGYDKTETSLTKELITSGISIHYKEDLEKIPKSFLSKETTWIIYTPAVTGDHKEFQYFKKEGFTIKKRAELLGEITKQYKTLAVAGTHGKTTTTAILAHLLKESGVGITAFLGGISENYHSNLVMTGTDVIVVEADEFDRSFLQLSPDIAAITSMDADHLDIYKEADALTESFVAFGSLVKEQLLVKKALPLDGLTFGIEDNADYCAINVQAKNGTYLFDLKTPETLIIKLHLNLPGRHNLLNAVTAFAMALLYGSPSEALAKALTSFKGVQRRFSYHINQEDLIYIDDYAHHPTEIDALHQAIREMHPGKKVTAIFQPHLFSRTRDFANDFGKSLSKFDHTWLLDIYPARELPIKGVDAHWLLEKIPSKNKKYITKQQLETQIINNPSDVWVTIGAGDIGEEVATIKKILTTK